MNKLQRKVISKALDIRRMKPRLLEVVSRINAAANGDSIEPIVVAPVNSPIAVFRTSDGKVSGVMQY
jgi:hypothetical protein